MKKILILILIVAAAALGYKYYGQELLTQKPGQSSTDKATTETSENNSEKTLIVCAEASPENFAPALSSASNTFDVTSRNVFDQLVMFNRGTTETIPGLAEKWDVSEDGKEYTFYLKKGVKFHTTKEFTPTRDFNADDVVFTFMRQWDKNHPYHKISGGNYVYFNSMGLHTLIKSIDKIDDYTVKFTLNAPEAPFISNIAMHFGSIFSKEFADKLLEAGTPEKLDATPVGTGPFQVVSYVKDNAIRMKAHPEYWRGKAPLDNVIFTITPDNSVRVAKLEAGECHITPYPNVADIEKLKQNPDINVLEKEGMNVGYLGFNTTKQPLDDVRVRQALSMAVNKQAILDSVFQGAGKIAKSPLPPTVWSYNNDIKDYEFDLEAAKALLQEAGIQEGLEIELWAMPVQRPYNPNAKRMAELVQADWAKIGVKTKIISFEWGEYIKRTRDGEHQALFLGWTGDNGDPDNFMGTLLSCDAAKTGSNRAFWCHPEFNDLVVAAKRAPSVEERTKLYKKAQEVFIEQAPWIPIANSIIFHPVRKEVVDFRINPFGGHILYGVDLKQ